MSDTRFAVALLLAVVSNGCFRKAPAATPAILHGEVDDPIGDALSDSRVQVSPDLLHATADLSAGKVTFVIQLAPGTLDPRTTRVSVLLDTDHDVSTGIRQLNGLGADFSVDLIVNTGQAVVQKADPAACAARFSCFNAVGSVPITVAGDSIHATLPLSLFRHGDGRMRFQVHAYVVLAPTSVVFDVMPDNDLPPGQVQ